MNWKEASNNRLFFEHPDGFIVLKPKGDFSLVPLFCPKCKMQMKTVDDAHSFRRSECCFECELHSWKK